MNSDKKYRLGIALFLVVFAFGCTGNKTNSSDPDSENTTIHPSVSIDSSAIFNGISLEGWKESEFGTGGPVYVSEGKIVINYGDGASGITYEKEFPKVNYEVSLEARKTVGNDFFCGMTFPVNNDFCSLIVGGWGGPVVGISCIDGLDAEENETKILKRFEKEVWYSIRLKVGAENIQAWIDNEKIVDVNYTNRKLTIRPEVEPSKPFGICTWMTSAELKNIRFNTF